MNFIIDSPLIIGSLYEIKNYTINSFYNINFINFKKIHVVEIIDKQFKVLYSLHISNFIESACEKNNLNALTWFKKSGHQCKYSIITFQKACKCQNLNILKWFKKNKLYMYFSTSCFLSIIHNNNIKFLEWFKQHNYLKNPEFYICYAIEVGNIICLDWFLKNGYEIKYDIQTLIKAFSYNLFNRFTKNKLFLFMKWLKNNNLRIKCCKKIVINIKTKNFKYKTKNNYFKGIKKN